MMNKIVIDRRDFDFLVQSNLEKEVISFLQENFTIENSSIYLSISKQMIEDILDYLENDLSSRGFDENDEPNAHGIMLEHLIDKFSREFYRE